ANMSDVAQILNRNDLDELNPLKFYIVRHGTKHPDGSDEYVEFDGVLTGRVQVQVPDRSSPYGTTYVNPEPTSNQLVPNANLPGATSRSTSVWRPSDEKHSPSQ